MANAQQLLEAFVQGEMRPKAARQFTDREDLREAYHKMVARALKEDFRGNYVMNYYGIGGVGKTTLLRKLQQETEEKKSGKKPVILRVDFSNETLRSVEGTLMHLRRQITEVYEDAAFPLFDMALYTMRTRQGEAFTVEQREKHLLDHPVLAFVLDLVGEISGLSLALNMGQAALKAVQSLSDTVKEGLQKRKQAISSALMQMETCDIPDFQRNLAFYFAMDVNAMQLPLLCVFIDTYERLSSVAEGEGESADTARWLYGDKGLVRCMGNAVYVIAGREKLLWEQHDPFWAKEDGLECHLIHSLSYPDSCAFLRSCGIEEEELHKAIYHLTHGEPVYLDLCVDHYEMALSIGKMPAPEDFGQDVDALVGRHLRYIPEGLQDELFLLGAMRRWHNALYDAVAREMQFSVSGSDRTEYRRLMHLSYMTLENEKEHIYAMHQVVAELFASRLTAEMRRRALAVMTDYVKMHPEDDVALLAACQVAGEEEGTKELAQLMEAKAAEENAALHFGAAVDWQRRAAKMWMQCMKKDATDLGCFFEAERAHYTLSNYLYDQGLYDAAYMILEHVYQVYKDFLGEEHELTISAMHNLTIFCLDTGNWIKALELSEKLVELCLKVQGEENLLTIGAMGNMALIYHQAGEIRKALELKEKVLAMRIRMQGEDHPDTISAMSNLANSYLDLGRTQEALTLAQRAYDLIKFKENENQIIAVHASKSLSLAYLRAGKVDQAVALAEEALELHKKIHGENHPETLAAMSLMVVDYQEAGRLREAKELAENALIRCRHILGNAHHLTILTMNNMAMICLERGEMEDALRLGEEALQVCRDYFGEEHTMTANVMDTLAQIYDAQRKYAKAYQLQSIAVKIMRESYGADHSETLKFMDSLKQYEKHQQG